MKVCKRCKLSKPLNEFSKNKDSHDRVAYICRKCAKEIWFQWKEKNRDRLLASGRKYYRENTGKRIASSRKWYANNKDKALKYARDRGYLNRYGITFEQRVSIQLAQDNKCAICKYEFTSDSDARLDHDHITGKVRALLCNYCNTMLGYAKENIEVLTAAIAYLRKHSMIPNTEAITGMSK